MAAKLKMFNCLPYRWFTTLIAILCTPQFFSSVSSRYWCYPQYMNGAKGLQLACLLELLLWQVMTNFLLTGTKTHPGFSLVCWPLTWKTCLLLSLESGWRKPIFWSLACDLIKHPVLRLNCENQLSAQAAKLTMRKQPESQLALCLLTSAYSLAAFWNNQFPVLRMNWQIVCRGCCSCFDSL